MLKKLVIAVSAALVSTSALAIAPSATAPDIEIFMSGATAQDNGIQELFTNLCADTVDSYAQGSSHYAYYCTVDVTKVTGGLPAWTAAHPGVNPKVLLHKRSAGGSAMGVNPLTENTKVTHLNIWNTVSNSSNCTESAPGSHVWSCTATNAGDTSDYYSDAGVSDVNPELFVGANTPAGFSPVNAAVVAAELNVVGAAAVVFGIPVTLNLRDALQLAQGLTVGAEDEANMPTLSKRQVASFMTGTIKKWNQFVVNGTALNTYPGVTAPSSTIVNICRRVNGSGTQAQMNANFLNYPCTPGASAPLQAPGSALAGPVINEGSGAGDVDNCLVAANTANKWAIGIQSTEKNANNAKGYRFVKIDGVAPTIANAANGLYMDWAEQTFQWRTVAPNALTGDKLNLVSTIATNAASPTTIKNVVNPAFVYTWGQGGYLALKSNGFAASFPFVDTNPVTPYTHTAGGGLDNCRTPVITSGNMSL
jgi:hypothetical protein